jgi:hypothetical protein
MHDCPCCGQPVYSSDQDERCWGCHPLAECDPEQSWHCFTGHCDGSGCTYPGECEPVPHPPTWPHYIDNPGREDRDYWTEKYA